MTREDEIAERLAAYPYVCAGDDARYLLARVRQLEGRLPPTSVDVAAVRKRLARATPGPWRQNLDGEVRDENDNLVCSIQFHANVNTVGKTREHYSHGDQDFIANAPNDTAALLAEVEHLRAVAAMLLSDNPDERVQAAVWETRRQTAQKCAELVNSIKSDAAFGLLADEIRRRFNLERQL